MLSTIGLVATAALSASPPKGILPPTNPHWPPTCELAATSFAVHRDSSEPQLMPHPPAPVCADNLSMSTITMTCNGSGWSSPERGAQFGIVSYDWSNAKVQWAAAKPMDCEKRLQTQARMTKAQNPDTHVFGYRNVRNCD